MLFAFHWELISSGSLEQTRSCSRLACPHSDPEGMEKCLWPSSVIGGERAGFLGKLQEWGLSVPLCVVTALRHLTPEPTRSLPPKFPFPVLASATALCLADCSPPPPPPLSRSAQLPLRQVVLSYPPTPPPALQEMAARGRNNSWDWLTLASK